MTVALILWGHALAALLFGLTALRQLRSPAGGWPHAAFVTALVATALWALATAGIDARDFVTTIAEEARNIAWLAFMLVLVHRNRASGTALTAVYAATMLLALVAIGLAVLETLPPMRSSLAVLADLRLVIQMMGTIGALVLVSHLHDAAGLAARGWMAPTVGALAGMWCLDLLLFSTAYLQSDWPAVLVVVRGFGMAGIALIFALAAQRGGDWSLSVSRTVAMRTLVVVGLLAYLGFTLLLTSLAGGLGGSYARLLQTAAVFGSTAALLTLMSAPWLRAWTKVKVAKHLFRHRYDYRTEWQRFAETLGTPDAATAPLAERIVKAVADLTDAPAGLLLVSVAGRLEPGTTWNWDGPADVVDGALADHLAATGRIIELDTVRAEPTDGEAMLVPAWMIERADAWVIVPLLRGSVLIGAILLARPPVDRALDWEDLDLLRVAGRQAASYLAEDRAHAALADAARFDEFSRRFAFIMHDIKNLVSGLNLVARNAERHADNPAFRADMVETLKDSAARMNALLARLSQHHHSSVEPLQPVDLAALAIRIAAERRAQHPIVVRGAGFALAQPGRIEQLLGHLVQNAIEASVATDAVTILVAAAGERASVEVIDTGCGMTATFVREQLFRPFASSKPGGFGIGAYEARQLAEAMGGSIAVASREGEGSRFRLILPAAPMLEAAA